MTNPDNESAQADQSDDENLTADERAQLLESWENGPGRRDNPLSAVWADGFADGYAQAVFDDRGFPDDSDAHTFPRLNPYRPDDES